jgi:hypothetical protein
LKSIVAVKDTAEKLDVAAVSKYATTEALKLCPTIDAHVKACVVVKSIVKTLVEAVVERHTLAS